MALVKNIISKLFRFFGPVKKLAATPPFIRLSELELKIKTRAFISRSPVDSLLFSALAAQSRNKGRLRLSTIHSSE